MKVKILVEFDVDTEDENEARAAASMAAYHNLTLTRNGVDTRDDVKVHVDGVGEIAVCLGEDHD
jgi:hypothetical protein